MNATKIATALGAILLLVSCIAPEADQTGDARPADSDESAAVQREAAGGYDSELAEKIGADEYGMSRYVMAFLKSGPNRDQSAEEAARIQRAHQDNIKRMAEEGKLVVAGPFMDGGETRGIYIFAVDTVDEARELTNTDPAVEEGRLVMELKPWYGPAALKMLTEIHPRVARKEI